ncbi:hypothetical protein Pcinc_041680 [Petrolisthes cinctipes]|uniref:Nucleoplasmin-like domain-containing protein n=1 Tax=Petrolisthes cinctipes TaxID=88211 RepID=A0AAE1BK96_PETCI|nr:hypothetical protein Pcinc_041680 [Petrolisthes cinctipes]
MDQNFVYCTGLVLEPGKRYSKVVDNAFHISSAALDTATPVKEVIRVLVEVEQQMETVIANLSLKHGVLQCSLDLRFDVGSQVTFSTTGGKAPVHLSGYVVLEGLEGEQEEEEEMTSEDSTDDDIPSPVQTATKKRKAEQMSPPANKKSRVAGPSHEKTTTTPVSSQVKSNIKSKIDRKKLLNMAKEIPINNDENDVDEITKEELGKQVARDDDDDDDFNDDVNSDEEYYDDNDGDSELEEDDD